MVGAHPCGKGKDLPKTDNRVNRARRAILFK